jgi:hypothetical protein
MEVERYLLSSALTGIISQKLARRLCPKCKKLRPTNEYEKTLFKNVLKRDVKQVYGAEGCEECSNGYKGRIAIHEVLLINQEIRDALSAGMSKEQLRDLVYNSGSITMLQDGMSKVAEGHSTVEEILKLIELDDDNLTKEERKEGSGLEAQLEATKLVQEADKTVSEEAASHAPAAPTAAAPTPAASTPAAVKVEAVNNFTATKPEEKKVETLDSLTIEEPAEALTMEEPKQESLLLDEVEKLEF